MSFCSCFGSRKKNKVKNDEEEVVNPETKSPEKQVPEEEPYSGAPEDNLNADNNNRSRIFSYKELLSATNNFASLIGEGGFGRVYKGRLPRSNQVIAVKKLNRFGTQGDSEFLVESHMLSVLSHPNLVTLIGYCSEGHQRLLVYEYMPLGSLADHLFEPSPFKNRLDWNTRMKIACGAARGVQYLHHQIDPPVIYRDLKSANILLGEGFDPKLSDFGLAKFGPTGDKTHVSTRVLGTYGYCAPEYAATGKLTLKSDIYSFGMVLLELITGRKALDDRRGQLKWLVNWVKPLLRDRSNFPFIADPLLKGEYPKDSLEHALEMAMMCLRSDAKTRPDMNDVVMGLEYLESLKYHPSNELTSLLNTKGKEREQAVAEAKIWGQSLRKGNQTASSSSTSSSSNPN